MLGFCVVLYVAHTLTDHEGPMHGLKEARESVRKARA